MELFWVFTNFFYILNVAVMCRRLGSPSSQEIVEQPELDFSIFTWGKVHISLGFHDPANDRQLHFVRENRIKIIEKKEIKSSQAKTMAERFNSIQ